jgi:hypothetical protein
MGSKVAGVQPFVRAPAAGSTLKVLGLTSIHKATGADTVGAFSVWETVVPRGTCSRHRIPITARMRRSMS